MKLRCLMTKGEKCTLKASKQSGVNDAISKGEEWKMQCKKMHGDRGRYLVNMGEKCNLMIPWTKEQNFFFIAHMVQTAQLLSSRKHFVLWANQMPVAF